MDVNQLLNIRKSTLHDVVHIFILLQTSPIRYKHFTSRNISIFTSWQTKFMTTSGNYLLYQHHFANTIIWWRPWPHDLTWPAVSVREVAAAVAQFSAAAASKTYLLLSLAMASSSWQRWCRWLWGSPPGTWAWGGWVGLALCPPRTAGLQRWLSSSAPAHTTQWE